MKQQSVAVEIAADTQQFDKAMEDLVENTRNFDKLFSSTVSRAIISGKSLEGTLRSIGQRFADLALKQALKPLEIVFGGVVGSLVGSAGKAAGFQGFENGGVFEKASLIPFANGGLVSSPTPFNFGQRLGVMGEAGPEAVMPLRRGVDGKLGVAAAGNARGATNIVFNISTSDANSFKRSEGQITAMLARAVSRGQRNL